MLELAEGASPCVGSGMCCQRHPCGFGEAGPTGACIHLVPWEGDDLGVPRFRCGIANEIIKAPLWEVSPAFGAGCCQPLFNRQRGQILVALRKRGEEPSS